MSKARDIASAPIAPSTVSATELGYVDGVTSAIQTQIDSKIGSASAINPTIVDAKGDIIAATAADTPARLAVGSNDTVLTADSSTATGLKWATPVSGSMTLLSTTATTSGNSITITGIDQTYKALKIVGQSINRAGQADIRIYPRNGSTDLPCRGTLNYHTNQTEIYPYDAIYATANNGNVTTSFPMFFEWDIFNYASTTREKTFQLNGAFSRAGLTPARYVGWNVYGVVDSTSAINALNFYSDQAFNAGQILVYGVN